MKGAPVLAFLAGAVVGATVAILFAPEKGSVTRRKIKDMVEDEKDRLLDLVDAGKEKIVDMIDTGKEKIHEAVCSSLDEVKKR